MQNNTGSGLFSNPKNNYSFSLFNNNGNNNGNSPGNTINLFSNNNNQIKYYTRDNNSNIGGNRIPDILNIINHSLPTDNNLSSINQNQLVNNTTNIQNIKIYGTFNNQDKKEESNKRSLSKILSDKIQKNEDDNLSYTSEYLQKNLEQKEKNIINKYKSMSYEISNANNININPGFKNNFLSIKQYFNKSGNKVRNSMKSANSFDMSYNFESKVFTNLENSFSKKLSFHNNINNKMNKKKITIKCSINEPHKASFTVIVGRKVEISKLKMTICEQLSKKNKVYATLKPNSICLMKNYSFVQEFGTVGDSILSDGDNIYIILIDSMKKAQLNEPK